MANVEAIFDFFKPSVDDFELLDGMVVEGSKCATCS